MTPIAKAKWAVIVYRQPSTFPIFGWQAMATEQPKMYMGGHMNMVMAKQEAEDFRKANKIPRRNWKYL